MATTTYEIEPHKEKRKHTDAAPRALVHLTSFTAAAVAFGVYMALGYAGTDIQGNVQRLFYFHMPSFFGALVAFSVTVFGGIRYLQTRDTKWDAMAVAGAVWYGRGRSGTHGGRGTRASAPPPSRC
jgi:hypothetical protein